MCGGDREQAVDARADDEQRVAGAQAGAVLRAQHAGERLHQRRLDRVEPCREDEQFGDELGRQADALGEPAGVQARRAEPLAHRLVAAAAPSALPARGVMVDRHAVADGDVLDPVSEGAHDARSARGPALRAA